MSTEPEKPQSFREAATTKESGVIADFWSFMKENKKWWLLPFLIVFGLIGSLIAVSALVPGAAPFIYALF